MRDQRGLRLTDILTAARKRLSSSTFPPMVFDASASLSIAASRVVGDTASSPAAAAGPATDLARSSIRRRATPCACGSRRGRDRCRRTPPASARRRGRTPRRSARRARRRARGRRRGARARAASGRGCLGRARADRSADPPAAQSHRRSQSSLRRPRVVGRESSRGPSGDFDVPSTPTLTDDWRLRLSTGQRLELRDNRLARRDAFLARDVVALRVACEERVARGAESLPDRFGAVFFTGPIVFHSACSCLISAAAAVPVGRLGDRFGPHAQRFLLREVLRPDGLALGEIGVPAGEEAIARGAEAIPDRSFPGRASPARWSSSRPGAS